jgi:hypothetical protein
MSVLYITIPARVNVVKLPSGFIWGVRIERQDKGFGFTSFDAGHRFRTYKTHTGALRAGRAAAYKWASQQCEQQQGYRNAPRKPNVGNSPAPPKTVRGQR